MTLNLASVRQTLANVKLTPRLGGLRLLWAGGLLLLLGNLLVSCSQPNRLETVKLEGVIDVITRNSPTTYYVDKHGGPAGLEYELAKMFADELGVNLRLRTVNSLGEIFHSLDKDYAAFAAAGLTITDERKNSFQFSHGFLEVEQTLVYRVKGKKPQSMEDLIDAEIAVLANSSHATRLRQLQEQHPELSWQEIENIEVVDLLDMLVSGNVDYVVIDSNDLAVHQGFFPQVKAAFSLSEPQTISWVFSKTEDDSLYQVVQNFFQRIEADGTLEQLVERYYGHIDEKHDYVGASRFIRHSKKRLPKYKDSFLQAEAKHGIDWRLLAAIGYQESHWRPRAKSPTGVRGLMMLTRVTAKEVGVSNRLDPHQSIRGGADYLAKIMTRLPERIGEPDRTWFALAAYNVGMGHLNDARIITQQQGGDPDKWIDVKERLPLLTQKKWYRNTKHGYARGYEPVDYVQNIRRYYDVLVWFTQPQPDFETSSSVTEVAMTDETLPNLPSSL